MIHSHRKTNNTRILSLQFATVVGASFPLSLLVGDDQETSRCPASSLLRLMGTLAIRNLATSDIFHFECPHSYTGLSIPFSRPAFLGVGILPMSSECSNATFEQTTKLFAFVSPPKNIANCQGEYRIIVLTVMSQN
jgi:hypothetical protein